MKTDTEIVDDLTELRSLYAKASALCMALGDEEMFIAVTTIFLTGVDDLIRDRAPRD